MLIMYMLYVVYFKTSSLYVKYVECYALCYNLVSYLWQNIHMVQVLYQKALFLVAYLIFFFNSVYCLSKAEPIMPDLGQWFSSGPQLQTSLFHSRCTLSHPELIFVLFSLSSVNLLYIPAQVKLTSEGKREQLQPYHQDSLKRVS